MRVVPDPVPILEFRLNYRQFGSFGQSIRIRVPGERTQHKISTEISRRFVRT
jgi:hypothetical protein